VPWALYEPLATVSGPRGARPRAPPQGVRGVRWGAEAQLATTSLSWGVDLCPWLQVLNRLNRGRIPGKTSSFRRFLGTFLAERSGSFY